VTLSIVMGVHLVIVWLLISSHQLVAKTKSGSLQLIWVPRPALIDAAPQPGTTNPRPRTSVARNPDRTRAPSEDNAIHPTPDWAEELHLAAKNAVAGQVAQQRHESDFAHAFPAAPPKTPQFAWDYAATHRVEALPQGGILINLSDNCVLIFFPLPLVGCGIGQRPANGDLFEQLRDR
jgi:hypothetical protein